MPFSEEELHRRLQQGTSPPREEEADALWAAIAGELPAGAAGGAVASTGRNWWWMLLTGLLLVVAGVAIFLPTDAADELTSTAGLTPTKIELGEEPVMPETVLAEVNTIKPATAPTQSAAATPTPLLSEPRVVNTSGTSPTASSPPTLHPRPRPTTSDNNQPSVRANVAGAPLIPTLDIALLSTTQQITPPAIKQQEAAESFKHTSRLVLGGDAGANVLWESYEGGTESAPVEGLQAGLRTALGQQARLTVGYRLGKGFTAHTGLGYTRTHTVLDYSAEFDTVAPHPSFPDQTTTGIARYSVTHNNRLEWLSLPLGLSYERQVGRVALGLGVGTSLNYQLSAVGKLPVGRSRSEVFGGAAETDRLHLSYYLAPELSISLAGRESLRFYVRGRVERLDFGASAGTGFTRSGWLLGGSFGVLKDL